MIITHNLKDFPEDALRPYATDAVHPDDFLLDQLDLYPVQTVRCVHEQIAACGNPAISVEEFLVTFKKTVPRFAEAVRGRCALTCRSGQP